MIMQFVLLRWYLRLTIWFRFLWQVSRMSLRWRAPRGRGWPNDPSLRNPMKLTGSWGPKRSFKMTFVWLAAVSRSCGVRIPPFAQ